MIGLLNGTHKTKVPLTMWMVTLQNVSFPSSDKIIGFGPFNRHIQKRWKKPVDSAQTRLENRTRDLKLDKLTNQLKILNLVLRLHELIQSQRDEYMSVQLLSRWKTTLGLNIPMGAFLRKYPHIFEIYIHPAKKNVRCKITRKMADLIEEEAMAVEEFKPVVVERLKKLMMMSTNGVLHTHALWLIRRELGLPDDFRASILRKYPDIFTLVDPDMVSFAIREEVLAEAEIEKWRMREFTEKWLSEFETKYAFPINFPTGFKIEKGFKEKLKNWQRLPYTKPYERKGVVPFRICGGTERFEKHAVGVIHEFLSLTLEKMVEVERLAHYRRDFGIEINVRELLLKHPGIFYISTKGETQTLFLREAYSKGLLVEPNRLYEVRRKMLDLICLGCRSTNDMQTLEEQVAICSNIISDEVIGGHV